MPVRVQLSRAKGWRLPENTVKVDRSTKWGNPFIVSPTVKPGSKSGVDRICVPTLGDAIECFRLREEAFRDMAPARHAREMAELRGKNLACWCKLGEPCHADVLIELANQTPHCGAPSNV